MSTLKVTNIQDTSGGNSSTSAEIYSGRAKAWVNFNGTGTVAIRADFNVSSITDNGTGNYTLNFTNALTDANFAPVTASQYAQVICSVSNLTTSTAQIRCYDKGGNVDYDSNPVLVAVFR